MLFRVLKLIGIDVPAQIEAAKANLARQVEHATEQVKTVAQEAATIAALYAVAAMALGVAIAMGLVALYVWVAGAAGVFAGLGAVAGVLILVAAVLAIAAAIKTNSLRSAPPRPAPPRIVAAPAPSAEAAGLGSPHVPPPHPVDFEPVHSAPPKAADLIEPLALFLSRYVKFPAMGNPVVDQLVANLRGSATGAAHEAVDRAAEVIRNGDRANLVIILSGAALAGWLFGRQARH